MRFSWGALSLCLFLLACDSITIIRGTSSLGNLPNQLGPYHILTEIQDPDGVDVVWLHYSSSDYSGGQIKMKEIREAVYQGSIPGQLPFTEISYYIEAVDGDRSVLDPASGAYHFWVTGASCTADVECSPGESCDTSGSCRRHKGTCTADPDCGKGFHCSAVGACVLAARHCSLDEICLLGEVCNQTIGKCVPRPTCEAPLNCPAGYLCEEGTQVCRRSCSGDAECGPGETCWERRCSGARMCETTKDCPKDLVCDPAGGFCRPAGGGPCAPCTHDTDCQGPADFCLFLAAGQFCGQNCAKTKCPEGFLCDARWSPPQCAPDGICPQR